jgi:hypothetical protein
MKAYMQDIGQAAEAADRAYVRNLLTLQGWHDFGVALWMKFHNLAPFALLAMAGLALPQRRRWIMPLWSVLLFVIWYVVMFNGRRWAISATLLLLAAAFIAWFKAVDWTLERWSASGKFLPLVFSGGAALMLLLAVARGQLMPRWIDRDLASVLGGPASVERQLAATRPGYALYRYIVQHNIGTVLQPSSDRAVLDVSAYNEGRDNVWILRHGQLPVTAETTPQFLRDNSVRYFIEADHAAAPPVSSAMQARARAVIAQIKPGARLVLRDPSGISLYALAPSQ